MSSERKVIDKRTHEEKWALAKKMIIAAIGLSAAGFMMAYNYISMDTSGLITYGDKLEFAVQWLSLSGMSMITGIFGVLRVRGNSRAMDPIEGNSEHLVDIPNRILRNTTEQLIMHVMGVLILTTYLTPSGMKAIPILVVIFVLGRICFTVGYNIKPMYRSFGFMMTFVPSLAVMLYCQSQFMRKYVLGFN